MKIFHRQIIAACLLFFNCLYVHAADWLELTNFNLIDGTGAVERTVSTMLVKNGTIYSIDDSSEFTGTNEHPTRIDLNGGWMMPGLIDTHVHVARFPDTANQARLILEQAIRGGITGLRDLGGDARALGEVTRALQNKEWLGPTMVYAGIYGGSSLFMDQRIAGLAVGFAPGAAPWTQAVDLETDLALTVAATRGTGVSGIKLYGNIEPALSFRVIQEARRQGLKSWAHATVFPTGPGDLVDAGVDSLSHAAYLVWEATPVIPDDYAARTNGPWNETPPDHPKLRVLFKKMAEKEVYLDATLYVYQAMHKMIPPEQAAWAAEASAWGAKVTAVAHKMGVLITTGTDWFEPAEGELPHTHQELVLLVEQAGLTPMDAIVAGTRNGAGALGVLDQRGTIEIGKAADLLILNKSPLLDIRNTRNIRMVVKDGVVLKPE